MNETTRNRVTVLLVDDCPFTRRALTTAIATSLPECEVNVAQTLAAAHVLGAEARVEVFIIDSKLPDGSGIDFLADMMMVHSQSHFILLADGPLPNHLDQYRWLDEVQILRKAVDRAQLVGIMREMLGSSPSRSLQSNPGSKKLASIRLKELSAETLIYSKIEARATTVLEFVSRGENGQIHLIHGKVMYAEAGKLEGKDALSKIMSWKNGFAFELQNEPKPSDEPLRPELTAPPKIEPASERETVSDQGPRKAILRWINRTASSLARAIQIHRNQPEILTD